MGVELSLQADVRPGRPLLAHASHPSTLVFWRCPAEGSGFQAVVSTATVCAGSWPVIRPLRIFGAATLENTAIWSGSAQVSVVRSSSGLWSSVIRTGPPSDSCFRLAFFIVMTCFLLPLYLGATCQPGEEQRCAFVPTLYNSADIVRPPAGFRMGPYPSASEEGCCADPWRPTHVALWLWSTVAAATRSRMPGFCRAQRPMKERPESLVLPR